MKSKRNSKRIKKLAFICTFTTILLGVSTYAWFIGMRTVNVSSFDVEIAATDSLSLSLDGKTWSDTISISSSTFSPEDYASNTNSWGGRGLIPMSSVGDIDSDSSRLMLYEKASLTATPGGYRLMASRVDNYNEGQAEKDGYVAFDLFVRNYSGSQYLDVYNILDEEAIYLTNNSEVTVASTGVANTGIENSVRVAFAQIGRVVGTSTDVAKIQGIACQMDESGKQKVVDGVTGICRTATIWEPNNTSHVKDAISWYETSCQKRTGEDLTSKDSFAGTCGQVIDGVSYPTYAISKEITSANKVDIYDGAAYNGYANSSAYLKDFDYFTDTEKLKTGTERPTFMTLEPNSITKIRVYIYIEGQDIDNYDFASIGKKISVKFGFTKERFTEDDINYSGEDLNQGEGPEAADKTAPIITLNGDSTITLVKGSEYEELGATAEDNVDGEIEASEITASGTVNTEVAGTYYVVYKVSDEAGNLATKTRTVVVTEE